MLGMELDYKYDKYRRKFFSLRGGADDDLDILRDFLVPGNLPFKTTDGKLKITAQQLELKIIYRPFSDEVSVDGKSTTFTFDPSILNKRLGNPGTDDNKWKASWVLCLLDLNPVLKTVSIDNEILSVSANTAGFERLPKFDDEFKTKIREYATDGYNETTDIGSTTLDGKQTVTVNLSKIDSSKLPTSYGDLRDMFVIGKAHQSILRTGIKM
jgi:hypothetical protein